MGTRSQPEKEKFLSALGQQKDSRSNSVLYVQSGEKGAQGFYHKKGECLRREMCLLHSVCMPQNITRSFINTCFLRVSIVVIKTTMNSKLTETEAAHSASAWICPRTSAHTVYLPV